MSDAAEIRDVVDNWAIWRDSGDWERLRGAWHSDGRMVATWFEGTADAFVAQCQRAWDMGSISQHILGGSAVEVQGDRAIAQTRMVISSRAPVEGVECDAACTGRFYDFFEKRQDRWAIRLRQPIYEKDRIDPVDPSLRVQLDPALLARFPIGYRHLAYMQSKGGLTVNDRLPGLRGPEVEHLYARGKAWLQGAAAP
jgi:hypothetical protein